MLSRPASGRPPKRTPPQGRIVRRWLADRPTEHGFETELWSAPRLARLIPEEFGIGLNPRYLSAWPRDRGLTPQKPQRVPRERDPEAIAAWPASDWPRINKKARRQRTHFALIDGSGLLMGPLLRRTWAPKGQTPLITRRGAHRQKVSVAAALWLSPRRDRLGLYSHTLTDGDFDNWYVTAFVEAMLKDLGGRFVVIGDGGNMHKGEPIDALESHLTDRVSLERLPPFAPRVVAELASKRSDQVFLQDLFHASELPLPRTLLF